MYNSAVYKKNARMQLAGNWWRLALLTLVVSVLSSAVSYGEVFGIIALLAGGVLHTAYVYVCLKMTEREPLPVIDNFFDGLSRFLQAVIGSVLFTFWTSLWSCLFVIPGLVKAVSYSQMFFVIAENPAVGAGRAMRISKILTQGHKADMALHALSFFPWFILCMLSGGIGLLWLLPYMTQSFANAYKAMKAEALRSGRLSAADFENNF